jgi:hypothetical protein
MVPVVLCYQLTEIQPALLIDEKYFNQLFYLNDSLKSDNKNLQILCVLLYTDITDKIDCYA